MIPQIPRRHWPELDLLRGVAAILMIANHTAMRVAVSSGSDLIGLVASLGSFAPVLFFTLTGLGHGIQSVSRPTPGRLWPVVEKALVLLAADVLLWIAPGRYIGLDFLGFIGLSMLVVRLFDRLPRPASAASGVALTIVVMRFVVGPALRAQVPNTPEGHVAAFLLGISGLDGFSYPPLPWLAYPLIGYTLGRLAGRHQGSIQTHARTVANSLAGMGLVFAAATVVLVARGSVVFRWGTVSWAFFVASLAVLGFALTLVIKLGARPGRASLLKLGGLQSFVVVPIHYLAIPVMCQVGPLVSDFAAYLITSLWIVTLSFTVARLTSSWATAAIATLVQRRGPVSVTGLPGGVIGIVRTRGMNTPLLRNKTRTATPTRFPLPTSQLATLGAQRTGGDSIKAIP